MGSGEITWHRRGVRGRRPRRRLVRHRRHRRPRGQRPGQRAAEQQRIFCVRADDATQATAWTPAVGRHAGVTVAVLGNREPRRSAAVRDEILEALREGTIAAPHHRDHDARRHPRRRRPGRPGADLDRRPQGADGGRRRGRRPARAARAARRAARRRRADRRGQAAARAQRPAGRDQPGHRRAGAGRQAGGAVQGRRQLRLRPRLRGGHRLPRGRRAGDRDPRPDQPGRRAGRRRHPGHPPRRRPRVHGRLRTPAARATPSRWSTTARSPGCAAPSS